MTKLKAGMIGVGDISFLHQPGYLDCEDAELYAICDNNEELLAARAQEWGIERTYTDYRELLANPDIDYVEILTPHHLHKPMVLDAARAGKHVSVQKPISTSVREADEMIQACKECGVQFKVFENFVFYPPYVKANELIEAGEIGKILSIRFKLGTGLFGSRFVPLEVEMWHLLESEKGMGQAVFDDGYHKWSMAVDFVGEVDRVRGWIDRSFAFIDMPGVLMWRYKNSDCLGYFDLAFSPNMFVKSKYFPADERIEITGTKGVIYLAYCTAQLLDTAPLVLYKEGKRYFFDDMEKDWKASFMASTKHFAHSLKHGGEPKLTGERARHVLQLALAAIRSSERGEEVEVDSIEE